MDHIFQTYFNKIFEKTLHPIRMFNILKYFYQMQENLDCRPKNYKKVGTVVGVGNKLEELLEDDQNKNLHPDWRRKKKNPIKEYLKNSEY